MFIEVTFVRKISNIFLVFRSLIRNFAYCNLDWLLFMETQEQAIEQLRLAVERKVGRKMQTNKHFDCLSDSVYNQTHAKISTTTLKRIWGYLSEGVTPRRYTKTDREFVKEHLA